MGEKKKKTFGIVEGDFVSVISTQFCTCKRKKKKSCTHSCTRKVREDLLFPGMPTVLILLYRQVNKRACRQTLGPVPVATFSDAESNRCLGSRLKLHKYALINTGEAETLLFSHPQEPTCTWLIHNSRFNRSFPGKNLEDVYRHCHRFIQFSKKSFIGIISIA